MSILLADNFSYLGRKPLDGRILYDTVEAMAAMAGSALYEGVIAYNKETELYYSWSSENTEDAVLGKWREFKVNGAGASVEAYSRNTPYRAGTLLSANGQLYRVVNDYTSDNTELTNEAAFLKDLSAGKVTPLGYMPVAPKDYTFEITDAGSGYAADEIIEVTDGVNAKILSVDEDGGIATVEFTEDSATSTNGSDAVLSATPVPHVANGDVWSVFNPTIGEDASLLEDVTANLTIGGITDGDTVDKDTTFTEFVKRLLIKQIIPVISFEAGGAGVHEIGTTVNGSHLKLTISNLAKVTYEMNQIDFLVNGSIVDSQEFVPGQNIYTFGYSDPITANTTVKVVLTYDENKQVNSTANISFVKASYYGPISTLTPDATDITALTKTIKSGKGFTWTGANLTDARFCYAYPASMGDLTSIKDANNFEYIGSYTKSSVTIDGTAYNVYILTDPVTITGAKQVYA